MLTNQVQIQHPCYDGQANELIWVTSIQFQMLVVTKWQAIKLVKGSLTSQVESPNPQIGKLMNHDIERHLLFIVD